MPTTSTRRKIPSFFVQRAVAGAPSSGLLRCFALAASAARSQITLRVVGSREGRKLNKKYRRKGKATNVLSFPYGACSGDVVLCHPVIKKEARQQQKSLRAHYAHLVVHGVLHLRGYDHVTRRDAARMERREIRILRALGFADPYAVR